jgi:hypothetical protein
MGEPLLAGSGGEGNAGEESLPAAAVHAEGAFTW